jgi:tetratricopeptide (TPR) repeat protein
MGQHQKALDIYMEAVESSPMPHLFAQVASCHSTLASQEPARAEWHYAQAITWMQRAVSLAPDVARWHAGLAELLWLGMLDYEGAGKEYRLAIELGSQDANVFAMAAGLYGPPEADVSIEEAISWLERAVRVSPEESYLRARLAALYHEAGRESDAQREWVRALLSPRPLEPRYAAAIERTLESWPG